MKSTVQGSWIWWDDYDVKWWTKILSHSSFWFVCRHEIIILDIACVMLQVTRVSGCFWKITMMSQPVDYFFVQNRQKSKNVKNQKLSKKTKPTQRTVLKLSPVLRRSPNKTKKTFWQLCSEKCLRIGAIFSQQQFCCVFLRSDTPIFDQTKTLFWLFPNRFNFTKEQKEEEEEEVEEDY